MNYVLCIFVQTKKNETSITNFDTEKND